MAAVRFERREPSLLVGEFGDVLELSRIASRCVRHGKDGKGVRIAAFDFDETLATVAQRGRNVFPKSATDFRLLFPTVPNRIVDLWHKFGYVVVVISNQRTICNNNVYSERQAAIFTGRAKLLLDAVSTAAVERNLEPPPIVVLGALGVDWYRKPCPGMWQYFVTHYLFPSLIAKRNEPLHNAGDTSSLLPSEILSSIDISHSFYVGDAAGRDNRFPRIFSTGNGDSKRQCGGCNDVDHSDCDYKLALNVGCRFFLPEDIFHESHTLDDFVNGTFASDYVADGKIPAINFDARKYYDGLVEAYCKKHKIPIAAKIECKCSSEECTNGCATTPAILALDNGNSKVKESGNETAVKSVKQEDTINVESTSSSSSSTTVDDTKKNDSECTKGSTNTTVYEFDKNLLLDLIPEKTSNGSLSLVHAVLKEAVTGERCPHRLPRFIVLSGPIGSGKTTFYDCLLRGLGYAYVESNVSLSNFTILKMTLESKIKAALRGSDGEDIRGVVIDGVHESVKLRRLIVQLAQSIAKGLLSTSLNTDDDDDGFKDVALVEFSPGEELCVHNSMHKAFRTVEKKRKELNGSNGGGKRRRVTEDAAGGRTTNVLRREYASFESWPKGVALQGGGSSGIEVERVVVYVPLARDSRWFMHLV